MIKYYKPFVDDNGFTYSIDMVKAFYYLSCNYQTAADLFRLLKGKCSNYWEKSDAVPCSKWSYYMIHLHLDSIYIRLGKYSTPKDEVNKKASNWTTLNCMTIEVNPNKHYDSELFLACMAIIKDYSADGYLQNVDYTVDVPFPHKDVVVLRTRKTYGKFKHTEYYGERGQHGFVRIYDKNLEADLPDDLTRIETMVKIGKKLSTVEFGIRTKGSADESTKKLSNSTGIMVQMLEHLRMLGEDTKVYLDAMNYRTRIQVEEALNGKLLTYSPDQGILDKLLADIKGLFYCSDSPAERESAWMDTDEDGFVLVDDEPLPWE